jgi:hypothetical protein
LHRLIENVDVSAYCDANVDISHMAPRGTESDANYLATSFPHGWARRNKQGHTKSAEFCWTNTIKALYPTFKKGEEMKSWRTSSAPHFRCDPKKEKKKKIVPKRSGPIFSAVDVAVIVLVVHGRQHAV